MKYFIDTEFLEGTQKATNLSKIILTISIFFIISGIFHKNWIFTIFNILLGIAYFYIYKLYSKIETKPTIDLISLALVSEDNREYYAISKDFNLKEAWNRYDEKKCYGIGTCQNRDFYGNCTRKEKCDTIKVYWIRENVLKPIFDELLEKESHENCALHKLRKRIYKDKYPFTFENLKRLIQKYGKTNKQIAKEIKVFCYEYPHPTKPGKVEDDNIQFCGYYADYDWVVFC